jgi:hypothetical protein
MTDTRVYWLTDPDFPSMRSPFVRQPAHEAIAAELSQWQNGSAHVNGKLLDRIAALEAALRRIASYGPGLTPIPGDPIEIARTALETAGEPLSKLECGMGCGRTFCSPEGRDHHEELCEGPTSKTKAEHE